ncbi:helix-turn-helix transcriptional regulator [Subsaximicrobium wynnwilliamsii]|jgi:DNA-binding transcriptional ArsR family regulator|uniref:Helix-turn-helix transcriptional regulator n=1 Tax=Subsaximicrobium wynnwilliamsii TaxID=291179 RepID=A0A5C6ZEU9_9FLAO|nr:metalloregulator ArsR/SmtB family transcription factor [Subsaximicrobium wynnwilliamsii]TXD82056.1 helix-turn-helix transcriptional regulator [Subsaximicrobium wynnwilliamsii]TXD87258.1 helix-turn-helix transcriptional regulator [Subsaximicrobium wynnwilliamsii]TXE01516.1 helix-turn-helix transcriptional regulator [Subsaximicrobium wynnwilliamsii]
MGLTKTAIFSDTQNEISVFAKVIGHPARVAILEQLFKIDSCICGDFVSEIGLAQATISQHLRELKQMGLIKGTIEGTSVCYCIHRENWTKMKKVMTQFLDQDLSEDSCC